MSLPSIFLTNLRSVRNKFDELCCQMSALNVDVAICTETWLSSNDSVDAFNINGYICNRTDRYNDSGHGGVAVWTKNNLCASKIAFPLYDFLEICAVQLPVPKLIVVGMYLPPGIPMSSFNHFCESFVKFVDDMLNLQPHHKLIVAGDFNQYDRSFLSSNLSLRNIVTGPTRLNANLDLIFVDKRISERYDSNSVIIGPPIGSSDHRSVFAMSSNSASRRDFKKHILFDLRLSNVLAFEQRFLSRDFKFFYSCTDIEDKCSIFYDFLSDAMSAIPKHVVFLTNTDQPWMTPFVKFLIDARWKAYRSRKWNLYNNLKLKTNREIWRAKKAFFLKKCKSPKGLWSYVNFERGSSKSGISSFVDSFGSLNDFLHAMNQHFCAVMLPSSKSSAFVNLPDDDAWFPAFTVVDVWESLRRLPCKATGSDDIPTKLYKKAALVLAEPLYHLMTECIRQRRFPSAWKTADVIPVPKTTGKSVDDYRPISLLPVPAKLTEKFILRNMKQQLSRLLGDNQFGIRKHSSTTHAIIATHDAMTSHADDNAVGASVFIAFDFSKAFDRIDHQKLIFKASNMNLPAGFVRLLSDYLANRQQRVRVCGQKSDLQPISSGVPQGSLLGPYLFGLFIACLQPLYSSTMMLKYVDDVSLVAPVRKSDVTADLKSIQSEVNNISGWSSVNKLSLNVTKTSGIIFSRGCFKQIHNVESILNNVQFKESIRFLGVVLDENLHWKSHVNFIVKKCAQRLYILRRLKSVTSTKDFFIIYCGLIRSLIEYACPAFIGLSAPDLNRLQAIQKRCLKIKKLCNAPDLASRRLALALSVFYKLPQLDTFLNASFPMSLPSGRLEIPYCRTSLRRTSFIPYMTVNVSSVHCD